MHSPVSVSGPLVGGTRAYLKLRSLDHRFPLTWQQYKDIRDAATVLCGQDDEEVQKRVDQLDTEITKLKLGKVVAKLNKSPS